MAIEEQVLQGKWGYAIVKDDTLWIPVIHGKMSAILKDLHKKTGINKMIFSAIMNPPEFEKHLKNIKRKFRVWHEQAQDWSYCIEIEYKAS